MVYSQKKIAFFLSSPYTILKQDSKVLANQDCLKTCFNEYIVIIVKDKK